MGFTECQKNQLKTITREIFLGLLTDEVFMDVLAKKVADKVNEQLSAKINDLQVKIDDIRGQRDELRAKIGIIEQQ